MQGRSSSRIFVAGPDLASSFPHPCLNLISPLLFYTILAETLLRTLLLN